VAGSVWIVADIEPRKRGSFEQQQVALAEALRARGIAVTCVYAAHPETYLEDALRGAGAALRALDFRAPGAAHQLWSWIREARPSLVHFHFVRAFSPLVLAARLGGARVVCHDRLVLARPGSSLPRDVLKRVRARTLGWAFELRLAVSPAVADSIAEQDRVPRERIRLVPNGIDFHRFASADRTAFRRSLGIGDAPLLCAVARLDDEKGIESAVRALALVPAEAHLAVVGEGPLRPELGLIARQLGVDRRLHLLGVRNDVEAVLAAATVVIAPTHGIEAFGFAVAEAMAVGKPLVVTDSGGMPWVAGGGALVVPRRDPVALAAAIRQLLRDEMLRHRLATRGRRRAQQCFSLGRWVGRVLAAYEELLGSFARPGSSAPGDAPTAAACMV
jgi:glycosyltransferase involved in cell wall biosynthesis